MAVAGIIFAASQVITELNMLTEILINTGMLAGFIIIVYFLEKDKVDKLGFVEKEQQI
jgi:hypothetical protein